MAILLETQRSLETGLERERYEKRTVPVKGVLKERQKKRMKKERRKKEDKTNI